MRNPATIITALAMLSVGLSGCILGDPGPLAADFEATTEDNQHFLFDARPSSGKVAQYHWDFGDGTTGEGATVEHTYQYIHGEYRVTLRVVDAEGGEHAVTKAVMTGTRPNTPPMVMATADLRWVAPGEEVLFDARATHDNDEDPFTLHWDFNYDIQRFEIDAWINLGRQQYEMELGTGGGAGDDPHANHESNPRSLGPPTKEELHDAWERYLDLVKNRPQHGPEDKQYPLAHEPDFDGSIASNDPVQYFSWPSPGLYFVRIQAVDIKGDESNGFFAIEVSPDPPARQKTETFEGGFDYAGPDSLLGNQDGPQNWWSQRVDFPFPGRAVMDFKVSQIGEADVTAMVCKSTVRTLSNCERGPAAQKGPVGGSFTLEHEVFELDPLYAFTIWVVARAETITGTNIEITVEVNMTFDTNPFWEIEHPMAPGGGHH